MSQQPNPYQLLPQQQQGYLYPPNYQPQNSPIPQQQQGQLIIDTQRGTPSNYPQLNYQLPYRLDDFEHPAEFWCQRCQAKRVSVLKYEPGGCTYWCCCCLCVFTIIAGLLPFYLKDCQNMKHICPACSTYVGEKPFKPC